MIVVNQPFTTDVNFHYEISKAPLPFPEMAGGWAEGWERWEERERKMVNF